MSHIAQKACIDAGQYAAGYNVVNQQLFGFAKLNVQSQAPIYLAEDAIVSADTDGVYMAAKINPQPKYASEYRIAVKSPCGIRLKHTAGMGRITTRGFLGSYKRAWIYVATLADGRNKLGMTSDVAARMDSLGGRLFFEIEVEPAYVKTIETLSMRFLGAAGGRHPTEYFTRAPEDAVDAIHRAIAELSKVARMVPAA